MFFRQAILPHNALTSSKERTHSPLLSAIPRCLGPLLLARNPAEIVKEIIDLCHFPSHCGTFKAYCSRSRTSIHCSGRKNHHRPKKLKDDHWKVIIGTIADDDVSTS